MLTKLQVINLIVYQLFYSKLAPTLGWFTTFRTLNQDRLSKFNASYIAKNLHNCFNATGCLLGAYTILYHGVAFT